jgi:hypothetical protein
MVDDGGNHFRITVIVACLRQRFSGRRLSRALHSKKNT